MELKTFEIIGTTPLLMSNPAQMYVQAAKTIKVKVKADPLTEAAMSVYADSAGFMWMPAQAFKSSAVNGGKGRKIGRLAVNGIIKSTVFPAEERVSLYNPTTRKPIAATEFEVDTRRAVNKTAGGIIVSRAKVFPWSCKVVFEMDETISPDVIEQVLNIAGRTVGVGAFRPEKGGPFGRYTARMV